MAKQSAVLLTRPVNYIFHMAGENSTDSLLSYIPAVVGIMCAPKRHLFSEASNSQSMLNPMWKSRANTHGLPSSLQ